jgi:hypothetical protein
MNYVILNNDNEMNRLQEYHYFPFGFRFCYAIPTLLAKCLSQERKTGQ